MVMSSAFNFMPTPHLLELDRSHTILLDRLLGQTPHSRQRLCHPALLRLPEHTAFTAVCPPHHLTRSHLPELELFTSPCLLFIMFNKFSFYPLSVRCRLSGLLPFPSTKRQTMYAVMSPSQIYWHILRSKNKGRSYSVNLTGRRKLFRGNRIELLSSEINMFGQGLWI